MSSFPVKEIFLLGWPILPVLLLWDGGISRLDGFILLAGFAWYVFGMLSDRGSWPHSHSMKEEANVPAELIVLAASLAALFVSGDIILGAATSISTMLMLPLFFVGLLAAVGTCLPELNFAIQAAKKRHGDIGIGDILGNVFADCMATIGVIAILSPISPRFPQLALLSGVIMAVSMAVILLLLRRGGKVTRRQGFVLVALYIFFVAAQLWAEKALLAP